MTRNEAKTGMDLKDLLVPNVVVRRQLLEYK
jgi:hypothetical protein